MSIGCTFIAGKCNVSERLSGKNVGVGLAGCFLLHLAILYKASCRVQNLCFAFNFNQLKREISDSKNRLQKVMEGSRTRKNLHEADLQHKI